MYCLPHYQEVVFPHFNQPDGPYDVVGFHFRDLKDFHWSASLCESDDYLCAGLDNMNMRRAVLARRQENTDRKTTRPDDGGQRKLTERLGYCNLASDLPGRQAPEHG